MTTGDGELLFKDEAHAIVGAAMKLHTELGNGFLEAVYQEGLALAFRKFGIPFEAQKEIRIELWGEKLDKTYFADFVCFEKIIVETKALQKLSGAEESQVRNYLKATGFRLGLLVNFGAPTTASFDAQIAMFPNMAPPDVLEIIEKYAPVSLGHKISGAGGGGYLILVSETPIKNALQVRIRR